MYALHLDTRVVIIQHSSVFEGLSNQHLTPLRKTGDPLCGPVCGKMQYHYWQKKNHFRFPLQRPCELKQKDWYALLQSAKTTNRFQ